MHVAPPAGPNWNLYNLHHLVAKFGTNAIGAIWWPNFEMQVVKLVTYTSGAPWFHWHHCLFIIAHTSVLSTFALNIARGTTDPGYCLYLELSLQLERKQAAEKISDTQEGKSLKLISMIKCPAAVEAFDFTADIIWGLLLRHDNTSLQLATLCSISHFVAHFIALISTSLQLTTLCSVFHFVAFSML